MSVALLGGTETQHGLIPVESAIPVAGGHFGRCVVGFIHKLCGWIRLMFAAICKQKSPQMQHISTEISTFFSMHHQRHINVEKNIHCGLGMESDLLKIFNKKLKPTTILWRALLCFAHAGGRLACAPGAVLLACRCGISCWLLLVVKLILGDHVRLLAFQSTWITVRRRKGLQNTEMETFDVSHFV